MNIKHKQPINSDILGWRWYSGRKTVGFVVIRNAVGDIRCFVGPAAGYNERMDVQYIAAWGAEVEKAVAERLFPSIYLPSENT